MRVGCIRHQWTRGGSVEAREEEEEDVKVEEEEAEEENCLFLH